MPCSASEDFLALRISSFLKAYSGVMLTTVQSAQDPLYFCFCTLSFLMYLSVYLDVELSGPPPDVPLSLIGLT